MNVLASLFYFFAAACPTGGSAGLVSASNLPHTCADNNTLNTIFITLFITIGAISFLFLVIGGARYVFSKGEPENIQKAKNEIKYSLTGLVIAAFAAAFVNYVADKVL